MKPRFAIMFWTVVLAVVASLYVWRTSHPRQPATTSPPPQAQPASLVGREVDDFTLTDQDGQTFDTADLDVDYWIANFFFTSCHSECIRLNQAVADLQESFDSPRLAFVSITVHPEYDTPEQLRKYAGRFDPDFGRWHFLTGDPDDIRDVARQQFLVSAEPGTHSDRLILLDRDGVVLGYFRGTDPTDMLRLKRRLEELLEG